jgi:tetratricopeptide (TPR) repeat protein
MALETEGRYKEALKAYEEAAQLQPSLAAAQFGIGAAQLNSAKSRLRSRRTKGRCIWDPKQALYYCGLGWAYQLQGSYGKAIESLKQAKELAPLQPEARQYL